MKKENTPVEFEYDGQARDASTERLISRLMGYVFLEGLLLLIGGKIFDQPIYPSSVAMLGIFASLIFTITMCCLSIKKYHDARNSNNNI